LALIGPCDRSVKGRIRSMKYLFFYVVAPERRIHHFADPVDNPS
jgi:hypothetical protein